MRPSRSLRGPAAAVVLALVATTSTAAQSPSPDPAVTWDSGTTRLTADGLRLEAPGHTFTAGGPATVHSDAASVTYRTLEVEWPEDGTTAGVTFYLAADRGSWWVTEVRAGDRDSRAGLVTLPTPTIRAPLGGTWEGDLQLAAGGATLAMDGVRMRAFAPDTLPAELRFCRPAAPDGTDPDTTDPLAPGQPLAGTGIDGMAPAGAKALLLSMGLCHQFRYEVSFGDGNGFGEVWCDAPPGRITGVRYGMDGEVLVFVEDAVPQLHTPRPQPPKGWGC